MVVVLMYHDVCADGDLGNWMRIPVPRFEAQLESLAEIGDFVTPDDLTEPGRLSRDRLSFLVTFDDGYYNNLNLAAPVLARRKVPALFFISTGPLETRQPFWTDVVVTPIQALTLRELDLSDLGLGTYCFRNDDPALRWDDIQRLLVAVKTVGNEDDPRIERLLAMLRDRYSEVLAEHLPRFAPLTREEVASLAAFDAFYVGSHGHAHRILTRLDAGDLANSLTRSRMLLEQITGGAVVDLAYPNGNHDDRVMAAAVEAGYKRGYCVRPAPMAGRVRSLALPRMAVGAFDSPAVVRLNVYRILLRCRRRGGPGTLELV